MLIHIPLDGRNKGKKEGRKEASLQIRSSSELVGKMAQLLTSDIS